MSVLATKSTKRTAEEPAVPTKSSVRNLAVSGELHALLKAKARAEGRVLQHLVESKLWELVQPELIKI